MPSNTQNFLFSGTNSEDEDLLLSQVPMLFLLYSLAEVVSWSLDKKCVKLFHVNSSCKAPSELYKLLDGSKQLLPCVTVTLKQAM